MSPTPDSPHPEPDLQALTRQMREFTRERDWQKFHDPKSIVLALMGEVGELAELFQWLPAGDAAHLAATPGRLHDRVGEEISDVLLYLLRLADVVGVDVGAAAQAKLESGHRRYPAHEVQGQAPLKD